MKVARGLFRSWVVLAVLWVGTMATFTWLELRRPAAPMIASERKQGKLDDSLADRSRTIIERGLLMALGPPAVVLVIGAGLVCGVLRLPRLLDGSPQR